jgi:subtilisin family serine protease
MMSSEKKSKYVVMPGTNFWNIDAPGTSVDFLRVARRNIDAPARKIAPSETPNKARRKSKSNVGMEVIDEVAPQESLLVSCSNAEVVKLANSQPGLRIVPVVELKPLWLRSRELTPPVAPSSARRRSALSVTVIAGDTGEPLSGVTVNGFTDRMNQVGVSNVTDAKGVAKLLLPATLAEVDVIEIDAPNGYWSPYARGVKVASRSLEIRCPPIDLSSRDVRDQFGLRGRDADGKGVVVAVIDTGVTLHDDLSVSKAVNVVAGAALDDVEDELGHGTHVCGIIAGCGAPGAGARGVAPGVTLHVYKVFGRGQAVADSFNIAKAIRQAVDNACDLINLSLGANRDMPDVLREVQRARALGVVCIAATGNDYRAPVSYPAAYSQVLAVSACGRKKTYPRRVTQELCATAPFGTDAGDYVADFSNVGTQVALIEPGVGIVSTLNDGYGAMDGTSMACPVATGAIARLLAKNTKILRMDRTQERSDAIIKLAGSRAKTLGFDAGFEGAGLLV